MVKFSAWEGLSHGQHAGMRNPVWKSWFSLQRKQQSIAAPGE